MKDTLLHIVTSLVENKDQVKVYDEEQDDTINFTVSVAKDDIGKVIGKEGKVIRAIRNVMKIPAIKQGKRINITLSEEA